MLKKIVLSVCFAVSMTPALSNAQDFPSRPLRIVVPATPGGPADGIARILAEGLRKQLNQTVIVENKPGAGTAVGAEYVARSAPDGYTLLLAGSSFSVAPIVSKTNYDPVKDFSPVGQILAVDYFMVVRSDLPVKSVSELISYAKANPGKINYSSAGSGSITHFQMELFKALTKTDIVHIPYKGAAPALMGMLAGEAQVTFDGASTVGPHIKSGALRPLGVAMPKRSSVFPEVPTMVEAGVTNFEATTWAAIFAPAGTPKPIVDRIHTALSESLRDPTVSSKLRAIGGEPFMSTPEQLEDRVKAEKVKWQQLAQSLGLKRE